MISRLPLIGGYTIGAVWYAIPGPGSTTVYTTQSQSGTTTSLTGGTANTLQLEVATVAGFQGLMKAAYDVTYTQTWSQSHTTQEDVLITYQTDVTVPGSNSNSIDHNYDQILLFLSPTLNFTGYSLKGVLTKITWGMDSSRAIPYPIYVGWLNGAWADGSGLGPMPDNVARDLLTFGNITSADFAQILGADPFAYDQGGTGQPNPNRFECVDQPFYETNQKDQLNYKVVNSYSSKDTTTTSHSYTIKLGIEGTWLGQDGKFSDAFTWSNSSATTNTSTNGTTDALNLRQPTAGYTGPTVLNVYVDKIYKTFMYSFALPPAPTAHCL